MIVCNNRDVFALLADGRACQWSDSFNSQSIDVVNKLAPTIIDEQVALVSPSLSKTSIFVAMTTDDRIYIYWNVNSGPTDITDVVHQAIGDRAETVQNVHSFKRAHSNWAQIAVVTERSVDIFDIRYTGFNWKQPIYVHRPYSMTAYSKPLGRHPSCRFEIVPQVRHTFAAGIDTVSIGTVGGFVKTKDHKLYKFRTSSTFDLDIRRGKEYLNQCVLTNALNCRNIRELVCNSVNAHLLMNNGSVLMRRPVLFQRGWLDAPVTFSQVVFPKAVSIARIVTHYHHIFYITTRGQCYYAYDIYKDNEQPGFGLYPRPVAALSGLYVENIDIAHKYAVIRYASKPHSKFCTIIVNEYFGINLEYINGTKRPKRIHGLGSTRITDVTQTPSHTYFVTDTGSLYVCALPWNRRAVEIPFFKNNPIEVENSDT